MPAALRALLEDAAVKKVGHGLKQAAVVLAEHGVTLAGIDVDTELASYLLDANRSEPELDAIALELLTYRACALESIVGKGAKSISPGAVAPATLLTWAGERADLAAQVAPVVAEQMQAAALTPVYETLERPLIPVLVALERAGVRVDTGVLAGQAARLEAELDERAERIYGIAGERFNINSPKQLGDVLFVKLQLPALKRTGAAKTPSTAQDVLEELALTHDLPREVIDWRGLQKLKGTYLDALPSLVHPTTGRVHTQFSQTTAATGRLSSRDPNLQNVPIRTELGREIRRAFIAEPGWRLISADYSQIELRVLAHLSGDPNLSEAFRLERGHPRPHRAQGVRRPTAGCRRTSCGGAPRSSTTRCSTERRRSRCRATSASRPKRRRSSSPPTSPASPPCARSSTAPSRKPRRRASSRRSTAAAGACRTS